MKVFHTPALLKEAIEALEIKKDAKYIDATIGGGGHGVEILKRGGLVLGIDVDQEAIGYVEGRWEIESRRWRITQGNLVLVRGNFKDLKKIALSNGFNRAQGILFDLGVSSYQLESQNRGFSFQKDAPLDMRMSGKAGLGQAVTAADLINGLTKKELYELFTKLAQEDNSWAITNSIIRARKIKPITTTSELANLIIGVYRRRGIKRMKIHPATKIFQALRVAVNDELNNLREALPQALELLDREGRLAVISFHSLEDKIVKDWAQKCFLNKEMRILTEKPVIPTTEEIMANPRARSAKMRVLEKI